MLTRTHFSTGVFPPISLKHIHLKAWQFLDASLRVLKMHLHSFSSEQLDAFHFPDEFSCPRV